MVFDTCVVVAAVKSAVGAARAVLELASEENSPIVQVLSSPLLNEYQDVLFRSEQREKTWTDEQLDAVLDLMLERADLVRPYFQYRPTLRDPGDELVFEAAVNGNADIVTFNSRDFAGVETYGRKVLTPRQVLSMLSERSFAYGTK